MSRRIQCGFEVRDAAANTGEFGAVSAANFSFDTTDIRPGTLGIAAGKFTGQGYVQMINISTTDRLHFGFWLKISGTPTFTTHFLATVSSLDVEVLSLRLRAGGTNERFIEIRDEEQGTLLATSTTAVPTGQWVRLEWDCYGVSNRDIVVWMDGIEIARTTGAHNTTSNGERVQIGPRDADPGIDMWFDDLVVNGESGGGTPNNGRPDNESVIILVPDADSSPSQWTPVGAVSHFDCINDFGAGASDEGTTVIRTTSTTLDFEDRWTFSDIPSGADSDQAITCIMIGVRGGGNGTTTRTAKYRARDASGNFIDGTNVDWNVNGFKTVFPIVTRERTWESPNAIITPTYVNGILGSMIETNTNNRQINCTAVWMSIAVVDRAPVLQPMSLLQPYSPA